MLVSHEFEFVVGIPAGCDDGVLRGLAEDCAPSRLRSISAPHRMDVPSGCEGYRRAMVVRSPLDRLVAVFKQCCGSGPWQKALTEQLDICDGDEVAVFKWWLKWCVLPVRDGSSGPGRGGSLLPFVSTLKECHLALAMSLSGGGGGGSGSGSGSGSVVHVLRLEKLSRDWRKFAVGCGVDAGLLQVPLKNRAAHRLELYGVEKQPAQWMGSGLHRLTVTELVGEDRVVFGW